MVLGFSGICMSLLRPQVTQICKNITVSLSFPSLPPTLPSPSFLSFIDSRFYCCSFFLGFPKVSEEREQNRKFFFLLVWYWHVSCAFLFLTFLSNCVFQFARNLRILCISISAGSLLGATLYGVTECKVNKKLPEENLHFPFFYCLQ